MLRLISEIKIGTESAGIITLRRVCNSRTKESWENLTNTFELEFPRAINRDGKNIFVGTDAVIGVGDKISVKMGYYPYLRQVFRGYITEIGSTIPLRIKCEDEMYLLKKTNIVFPHDRQVITSSVTKTGKVKRLKKPRTIVDSYTLDELLDEILPDYIHYEAIDKNMQLSKRAYTNIPVTRILEDLRSTYGLFSFFRDDEESVNLTNLHVGFASDFTTGNESEFTFERNIINSDNLKWQNKDQSLYKVVVKLIDEDNNVEEHEEGDSEGSVITLHKFYDTSKPKPDIKKIAQEWLSERKFDGYVGSFTTFFEPYVRPGDRVKLISHKLPERNGVYLVKTVEREFGKEGGRQEIFIDKKVG